MAARSSGRRDILGEDGLAVEEYAPAYRDACLAVFDSNVPDFFLPEERAEYEAFLSGLPGPYFVLVNEDGAVAGCAGYSVVEGEGRADLCWGMVRHELHGRGLGRHLTRLRIERALQDPAVSLIALNTSQHTAGFYESLGFHKIEVIRDGYGPGLDRCEMRLGRGSG